MNDPEKERLDELGQQIDDVRRTAADHGTLPDDELPDDEEGADPTFTDPDADGVEEDAAAEPPG